MKDLELKDRFNGSIKLFGSHDHKGHSCITTRNNVYRASKKDAARIIRWLAEWMAQEEGK